MDDQSPHEWYCKSARVKFGGETESVTDAPTEMCLTATISLEQNALVPVRLHHTWLLDPRALPWTLLELLNSNSCLGQLAEPSHKLQWLGLQPDLCAASCTIDKSLHLTTYPQMWSMTLFPAIHEVLEMGVLRQEYADEMKFWVGPKDSRRSPKKQRMEKRVPTGERSKWALRSRTVHMQEAWESVFSWLTGRLCLGSEWGVSLEGPTWLLEGKIWSYLPLTSLPQCSPSSPCSPYTPHNSD